MIKYDKLTKGAKLALADIFVALEEKCIQYGRVSDVLVIKPDVEKNVTVCGIGQVQHSEDMTANHKLIEETLPYLDTLKNDFSTSVIYKFITTGWDKEIYIKSSSELITEKLLNKVKDPEYKVKKLSS